jgi:hypothetical protein
MSLSATRLALSHVGAPGGQGPHFAACSHPQVCRLFWSSQSAHWAVRAPDLQGVQCTNLPALPHAVAALSTARPPHDPHPRQRSLSSRCDSGPLPSPTRCTPETAVSSTLQPAARADRASLETDSVPSNTQPLLPYTRRSTPSRQCLLQSLASTKCDLAKIMQHYAIMLHYLRRCV